jgi:hypothetical protein
MSAGKNVFLELIEWLWSLDAAGKSECDGVLAASMRWGGGHSTIKKLRLTFSSKASKVTVK